MIVVAIIGLLAAIALPQYRQHTIRAADNACLAEAKAYMAEAIASLASNQAANPYAPSACTAIGFNPVVADYLAGNVVVFTVGGLGETNTQCNVGSGACQLQ